jgi:hypothetical protein
MLGAHPDVHAIPFETEAFAWGRHGEAAAAIIDAAVAETGRKQAAVIVEKTPGHLMGLKAIRETFPDARFVALLRDPRDVVSSVKRRTGDLQTGIKWWRQAGERLVIELSGKFGAKPIHLVRYESLVDRPGEELDRLCRFLGLRYTAAMLDFWKDERDWFRMTERRETDGRAGPNHSINRNWQIHQPLMRDRVGIFRRELGAEELHLVEAELGPLAAQLGYQMKETV